VRARSGVIVEQARAGYGNRAAFLIASCRHHKVTLGN
jgi:hypothetical protein